MHVLGSSLSFCPIKDPQETVCYGRKDSPRLFDYYFASIINIKIITSIGISYMLIKSQIVLIIIIKQLALTICFHSLIKSVLKHKNKTIKINMKRYRAMHNWREISEIIKKIKIAFILYY
jgi:hypothetical protein